MILLATAESRSAALRVIEQTEGEGIHISLVDASDDVKDECERGRKSSQRMWNGGVRSEAILGCDTGSSAHDCERSGSGGHSTCSPPASTHGNVESIEGVATDEWHCAVVTVRSRCGYARVACRLTPSVMPAADRASDTAVADVVVVVVVAIVVAPVVPPTSVVVPSSALAVRTSVRAYAAVGRIARPSVES
jgi:hypothetical protein